MIRVLCLVFVFSVAALWTTQASAAPQEDEYTFDEGAKETPAPVLETEAEQVKDKVASERSVPKLKSEKPGRLLGAGTSAVGGFCCGCIGAPIGALAAYLISGTQINFLRVAIVMGTTFVAGLVMGGLRFGVLIATGTASAITDVSAIGAGGTALSYGLLAVSSVVVAGTAGATWYFTDGMDGAKAKSAKATPKAQKPPQQMAVAY